MSAAPCDPPLVEETSSSPPVSEESEVDRTDHGGIKKVCFKVSEDEQEDSGHDTMSYRDSYRCVRSQVTRQLRLLTCGKVKTAPFPKMQVHQSMGLTVCVWWGGGAEPGASGPLGEHSRIPSWLPCLELRPLSLADGHHPFCVTPYVYRLDESLWCVGLL